jgi:muconolactone delta-isomerase
MKFLGISKAKDVLFMLPPAVVSQLMDGTAAVISQEKKEGKILEFYIAAGWGRAIVITEAKTAEEVMKNILALPIASFLDIEVYPLADGIEGFKLMTDAAKAMAAKMPGAPK